MAKDYKDRIPAYRRRSQHRAARAWALAGAAILGVLGVAALGMHFFMGDGEAEEGAAESVSVPMPPPAAVAPVGKKPAPGEKPPPAAATGQAAPPPPHVEPRFSFYKVLPEKEVIIAESEIKALKREEESQGKVPTKVGVYMVQAGAFTKREEADRLRGQLAQMNIKAKLEMIQLDNTAWFRVKVGPYATLADADKVRQYLRSNRVDSVVQKATR
jgi:cell division protein FtsN